MTARLFTIFLSCLLASCAILPGGKPVRHSRVFLLEASPQPAAQAAVPGCAVVVVNAPRNAPGQSGAQMLYQREANEIERFAYSRWASNPSVMLEPLLIAALRANNSFGAVMASPSPVTADVRVQNDDLWLIQIIKDKKSHIELRMHSHVVQPATRQLLGSRIFSYDEPATEATAAAGVAAADRAVGRLLQDFASFVAETVATPEFSCRATQ
ncbi:MAG: hypothetical protein HKM98_09170 [Gammaproteobacteria bacterium]|nr:hypothetical protein [Gammaproteobacteria bacterium]